MELSQYVVKMRGSGSGSCPISGFDISDTEQICSAARESAAVNQMSHDEVNIV
jgi:hypothetical protein